MKIISWNINGIRAAIKKGFREFVESESADMLCLQETKAHVDQLDTDWIDQLGYCQVWNSAQKKGYSGTAIWSKIKPKNTHAGIGNEDYDHEGRVTTAEFDKFQLVSVYTPNSQRGLTRLDYRCSWDKLFLDFVVSLNRRKPVIFCGDLNVAHKEIDLANPKANRMNAGFTDKERGGFDSIVSANFVDSFRAFNDQGGQYTWWTMRTNAREKNIGWRLDYFCVSKKLMSKVVDCKIRADVFGSDHCPIELTLDL
jgi:exodeoxyribonuclease III